MGCCKGVTWTFVRGAEAAEDDASEASLRDCPLGSSAVRPRGVGVAVPSEEAFEETDTAAGEANGCIEAVVDLATGTTVCVEVVDREDEEDCEGAGECDLGVGVAEGDLDTGRWDARLSACRAFSLDRINSRVCSGRSLSNCRNSFAYCHCSSFGRIWRV